MKNELQVKELQIKHPNLVPGEGPVIAAKNIRIELKKAFPKVKFSVRSEYFSGGNSVDVRWTDGPTSEQVDGITRKYTQGDFDGMTDCYDYKMGTWNYAFGSAKYIGKSREFSDKLVTKAICEIGREDGIKDIPEVEDYRNGRANGTPLGNIRGDYHWTWQSLINRKCSEISESA